MFEFIVISMTGVVLLLLVTVVWAHRKLSGQQVFKGGNQGRGQLARPPSRSVQLGFIAWFSAGGKTTARTKMLSSSANIKKPWGW